MTKHASVQQALLAAMVATVVSGTITVAGISAAQTTPEGSAPSGSPTPPPPMEGAPPPTGGTTPYTPGANPSWSMPAGGMPMMNPDAYSHPYSGGSNTYQYQGGQTGTQPGYTPSSGYQPAGFQTWGPHGGKVEGSFGEGATTGRSYQYRNESGEGRSGNEWTNGGIPPSVNRDPRESFQNRGANEGAGSKSYEDMSAVMRKMHGSPTEMGSGMGMPDFEGMRSEMMQKFGSKFQEMQGLFGKSMKAAAPKMTLPTIDDLASGAIAIATKDVATIVKAVEKAVKAITASSTAWDKLETKLTDGVSKAEYKQWQTVGRKLEKSVNEADIVASRIEVFCDQDNETVAAACGKLEEALAAGTENLEEASEYAQ